MVLNSPKLPGQLRRAEVTKGSGTVLDARSSMSFMLENLVALEKTHHLRDNWAIFSRESQWTRDDESTLPLHPL